MRQLKQTPGGLIYSETVEEPNEQPKEQVPPLDEHELTSGRNLLTVFRDLPEEAQVEVFARIKQALLRRGGGRVLPQPKDGLAHELADVFYRYGHEQEEWT